MSIAKQNILLEFIDDQVVEFSNVSSHNFCDVFFKMRKDKEDLIIPISQIKIIDIKYEA